jgi:NAD(P)-dependent dehydrogenase (short-subunit alcohol dehydrogenase family)
MSQQKSVVITGGTGALGRAVTARLIESGAKCHVTWLFEGELEGLPSHERMVLRV